MKLTNQPVLRGTKKLTRVVYLTLLLAFAMSTATVFGSQSRASATSEWQIIRMSTFSHTLIAGTGPQYANNLPGYKNALKQTHIYRWCIYVSGGSVDNVGRMNFFAVDLGAVNDVVVRKGMICTKSFHASRSWQYAEFEVSIKKGWVKTSTLYLEELVSKDL